MDTTKKISGYIKLIRPWQWYKNVVIFLAIFFIGEFFHYELLLNVFLGFIALCLVSSSNYVFNDIIDRDKDKLHPEKKARPIASGAVKVYEAIVILVMLLAAGLALAYMLGLIFFFAASFLFVITLIYSLWLKNEPIIDILIIAINFVVRAVSGTFIIKVLISPWLILCPFFLALFLAAGKRDADIRFVKNPKGYKEVLQHYSKELIHTILIISATGLIMAYALYSFSRTSLLLITMPVVFYAVLRYYKLINSGSDIARHPEKIMTDWRIIIAVLIYILMIWWIFYYADYGQLAEWML